MRGKGHLASGRCSAGVVHVRHLQREIQGSPVFLGYPHVHLPCSQIPVGPHKPWPASLHCSDLLWLVRYCPPLLRIRRPRPCSKFRDSITRLLPPLHTLRAAIAERLRNVRFRLLARLCRVGVATHRITSTPFHIFIGSILPGVPGDPLSRIFHGAT